MIPEQVTAKLRDIRSRKDLTLRKSPYLRDRISGPDGVETDFKLRYYQVQGILHLVVMSRFLLGDDCGLGKTAQSIAACCFLWEKEPSQKVVVLTTKSALNQWHDEFLRFTKGVNVYLCKGTPNARRKAREAFLGDTGPSVLVMGYSSLRQDFAEIQDWADFILVADEASSFKSHKSQIHQAVYHLSMNAKRVWSLTATLIENNLMEGWAVYRVTVPNLFGTYAKFVEDYCITRMQTIPGTNKQIPIVTGYRDSMIPVFREKIEPFFLGRAKADVAAELPPLTRTVLEVEMSAVQKAKYKDLLKGILEERDKKDIDKMVQVTYCQQIVNHPALLDIEGESGKLNALIDLLAEGDLSEKKVIVFSRFRKMVDIIMDALAKAKIPATRITGSENDDQRTRNMKEFQNPNSDTKVICITTAAKQAVNLQAAAAIIFYDTPWSGGDYIQILGRMIRIGSTHDSVQAIHLVASNTIDDRVQKVLRSKMRLVEAVLGKRVKDGEDVVSDNDKSDLDQIYEMLQQDAVNL